MHLKFSSSSKLSEQLADELRHKWRCSLLHWNCEVISLHWKIFNQLIEFSTNKTTINRPFIRLLTSTDIWARRWVRRSAMLHTSARASLQFDIWIEQPITIRLLYLKVTLFLLSFSAQYWKKEMPIDSQTAQEIRLKKRQVKRIILQSRWLCDPFQGTRPSRPLYFQHSKAVQRQHPLPFPNRCKGFPPCHRSTCHCLLFGASVHQLPIPELVFRVYLFPALFFAFHREDRLKTT